MSGAVDPLGDWLKSMGNDTAIGQLLTGGQNGWFGIGATLPDRESRKPIWIEGKGWRINRANGSPANLTDQENRWWGITPESVDQRLNAERAAKLEGRLEARDARNYADTRAMLQQQQRNWEQSFLQSQQQHRDTVGAQTAALAANTATTNRQIDESGRQFDANRMDAAAALQARNALDERRLGIEEQIMLGNIQQRDFENQMMLYLHAQKNADAERARISGIADSLTRAFASLKI